jgi:pyrimidine-nucleoside phosphorylase
MAFLDTIARRRDGQHHTEAELRDLARAAADGSVPDYQIAAWLMAAYLHPLDEEETAWLTLAMADSGERLDLSGLPKPWVDKHSTGGVGDKTTLVLLPLLAACGLTMVKMSGRGLGITGGTVDKLSSVAGLRLDLSPEELIGVAREVGFALGGQTARLAPADGVLYALRDATGTVGSMPLIVSSILSKKIAGGAETIVLDVKCGSGGFMRTLPEARELARWLKAIGERCGLRVRCAITDMSTPLGAAVGNALEVREAWDVLSSASLAEPVVRFRNLCLDLAGVALETAQAGNRALAEEALSSGRAAQKFEAWLKAQGATSGVRDLPTAPVVRTVAAAHDGWVSDLDAERVGLAVVGLGGGRKTKADTIDSRVGIVVRAGIGARVEKGDPILEIHAADEASADEAEAGLAVSFSDEPVEAKPALIELA